MRALVEDLCSDACAGRRAGTEGGRLARAHVVRALRDAGADPQETPLEGCAGANVVARFPGDIDRWVIVGAHYDHLGAHPRGAIYRGADDNAAAVAALVELARALATRRPDGRGVMLVAFDGEEPPFYGTGAMGSQEFVQRPPLDLATVDMMVALELLGRGVGPTAFPDEVRQSLFVLGAERSEGTSAVIDARAHERSDLTVRRADAEVIPPLSDHLAFWEAKIPFMLVTGLRSADYHTPRDTPATLEWGRVDAVSRWLEAMVRDQCVRDEAPVRFLDDGRDDRATLAAVGAMLDPLAPLSPLARGAAQRVAALRDGLGGGTRLDAAGQSELRALIARVESSFGSLAATMA